MNQRDIVILLTSSIKPLNTPNVAIPHSIERENQYLLALRYYASLEYPVVFIDSSNIISERIQAVGKEIKCFEYHSFLSSFSYLGKGHGEKEILDYAIQNSKIISEAKRVIKITGRYRIANLKEIINKVKFSNAEVHVNFASNLMRCDSRIIIFKPSFYNLYFKPSLEKYLSEPDKQYFEDVLSQAVHLLIAEKGIYEPLPKYPFYIGFNGENGRYVNFSWFKKMKYTFFYQLKLWIMKQII